MNGLDFGSIGFAAGLSLRDPFPRILGSILSLRSGMNGPMKVIGSHVAEVDSDRSIDLAVMQMSFICLDLQTRA